MTSGTAGSAEAGSFCAATEDAVKRFQRERGLRDTGACDEHTWRALVEATWKLGDRPLVLTSPNLRGDDVGELQTRLARLGFDCGRVDGIFGPLTAHALGDFQSNCGLPADGACGPDTLRVLVRVSGQTGSGPGISTVREQERLRDRPSSLAALRVAVGQFGGLSSLTRSLTRELRAAGAHVMPLDEPDAVTQANAANHFGAHVYLGFEGTTETRSVVHYYRVPTFESVGGRALATCLVGRLANVELLVGAPCGMRLPVLRETKMPAVLCTLGPVRLAVDLTLQLTEAIVGSLAVWTTHPT